MNLWEWLAEPRLADNEVVFREGGEDVHQTWGAAARGAMRVASALRDRGVRPGDRVAAILTNSSKVAVTIPGIWFAGATVVSLPTIARGVDPEDYLEQLRFLCKEVGSEMILIEERYASLIPSHSDQGPPFVTFESLKSSRAASPEPPGEEEVALVQYSSGSTSNPKGCILTSAAIERQLTLLGAATDIDSERDRGVMWLPLSHDMGLFGGLLLAWTTGMAGVMSRPERFLTSPRSWFDECAEFGGTVTVGPGSALAAATRAARRRPPRTDLALRICILGGERLEAGILCDALEVLGPSGLAPEVPTPAYGLAEATLAVTVSDTKTEPRTVEVDGMALLAGELCEPEAGTPPHEVVSCGAPIPGVEVRIDGEGEVGEICVRSPSLAEGYLNDLDRTDAVFVGDELRTGDWGFLDGGELFVVGRLDDMITVGGRNVYLGAIEAAIGRETAVRTGNCAIVDVIEGDRSSLVMIAEPDQVQGLELREVAREARRIAASRGGLSINECMFIPRGTFPKTPSGKVQRFRCRELIVDDDRIAIERVVLS